MVTLVLKVLTVTDEFTKTALAIEVERSIAVGDLVRVFELLVAVHRHPRFIQMDNRPEITCNAIVDCCHFSATGLVFIEPGSPWRNAFVESFNGKLWDELLAIELFHSLLEAKVMAEDYLWHYNSYRPHSSLGYQTPNEFHTRSEQQPRTCKDTGARNAGRSIRQRILAHLLVLEDIFVE